MIESRSHYVQTLSAFVIAVLAVLLAVLGILVENPSRATLPTPAPVTPGYWGHKERVRQTTGQLDGREFEVDGTESDRGHGKEDIPASEFASEPEEIYDHAKRLDELTRFGGSANYDADSRRWSDELGASEDLPEGSREERPSQPNRSLDEFNQAGQSGSAGMPSEPPAFYRPNGYWANTHIPGDPAIRLLHSRLVNWDRSQLPIPLEPPSLEMRIQPLDQPFDAPVGHALALSLMADHKHGQSNETYDHVTLQVGIRAIEHRRGERPAMNLAVVLDIPRDAPDRRRIEARALVDALMAAKGPGDRFSLLLTDPAQGLVISPDEFRFGTVQLLRKRLLGESMGNDGQPLPLPRALAMAADFLGDENPTADREQPLGTRSMLLVTASDLSEVERLAAATHERAVRGLHLSAVPLGNRPDVKDIDNLILAGLGHRRVLESPSRARALIEEELRASTRAVAQAARLSIRLAPGVKLLGIPGSHPLDAQEAGRVRDIEEALDQKLDRQLGIRTDRGEDEEGIQIVIPTIDSGDEVVILLELAVASSSAVAAPLADVSLRYKDLAFLTNASLADSLLIESSDGTAGSQARIVQKNRLARAIASSLESAGRALGMGRPEEARNSLTSLRKRLRSARHSSQALLHDPDLLNDERVLDQYLRLLDQNTFAGLEQAQLAMLSDSLRFAAWAKTHQPLETRDTHAGP